MKEGLNVKFNRRNLMALIIVTTVFILSGSVFLIMLAFGLFGLSRLLIYFHLAEFTYNQGFNDNLLYYGSYILIGYFLLVCIEYIFDQLKTLFPEHVLFKGYMFHIMTISVSTIMFYFFVHLNYSYIHINFFVVLLIITVLYLLTEMFYPDSENLNKNKQI